MQERTSSKYDDGIFNLQDVCFSHAPIGSIHEFLCDAFDAQRLSPAVLRALLSHRSERTNIDWHELVSHLTAAQYATEMSLDQALQPQKIINSCETCGHNCDCPSESSSGFSSQHLGKASILQENRVRSSDMDEREQGVISTSPEDAPSPSPRKSVRFASPSSLSSPSKKRCAHDQSVSVSDNPTTSSKNPDSAVGNRHSPTKRHSRRKIPLVDPSADPFEDVCMSGALDPDAPSTDLSNLSSIQARRLRIMSVENDSTVCSDILKLQVEQMPFRLVSQEEFAITWADAFLTDPHNAFTELSGAFYTFPLGISTAKILSDYSIRQLLSENAQALRQETPTITDEVLNRKMHSFQKSLYFRRVHDHIRIRTLLWFGGEFHRRDYSCVKYPEDLIGYVHAYEEESAGLNDPAVRDFWNELEARGRAFWREFGGVESDVEDSEFEIETDESKGQSPDRGFFDDDTPGQIGEMDVSGAGVESEDKS